MSSTAMKRTLGFCRSEASPQSATPLARHAQPTPMARIAAYGCMQGTRRNDPLSPKPPTTLNDAPENRRTSFARESGMRGSLFSGILPMGQTAVNHFEA